MPVERSLARVPGDVFSEEWLASLVNYVRDRICMDEVRVFDGDVRMISARTTLVCEELRLSLDDCDGA